MLQLIDYKEPRLIRKEAEEKAEKRAEYKTAVKTAKAMLSDNEPLEKIIKYSGLTEKQINDIRKTL